MEKKTTIQKIHSRIIWSILRLTGIDVTYDEVLDESQGESQKNFNRDVFENFEFTCTDNDGSRDVVVDLAKEIYGSSTLSKGQTDNKVNLIVSLATVSASILMGLFSNLKSHTSFSISIFVLFLLFIVIYLCIYYFNIERSTAPSIEIDYGTNTLNKIQSQIVRDLIKSYNANEKRRRFAVDVFRSIRRLFVSAFGALFIFIGTVQHYSVSDSQKNELKEKIDIVTEKIKSDPRLTNLFKGPKGDQGPPGSPGIDGDSCVCTEGPSKL